MTALEQFKMVLLAGAAGLFLIATQAQATGGLAGLLHVGETSWLRPVIEEQLGDVPLVPRGGHDGQMNYVMALDPLKIPDLGEETGYRYRRILYPAVSSLGGTLDGRAALVGLAATAISGFALATAAVGDIAVRMGWSRWATLGVLANPGAWLSLRLLTSDAMALGLGLLGLALFVRKRHSPALVALALAALAKDQALVVAGAISVWLAVRTQWRLSALYLGIPAVPLSIWSLTIVLRGEDGFTPRSNLGVPFRGIIESMPRWSLVPTSDAVLSIAMVATVVLACVLAFRLRRSWLGTQLLAWALLAFASSDWVWDYGNNVARAFSHLTAMVALGLAAAVAARRPAGRTVERVTT